MRVHTHMSAGIAGAVLLTLVGTSAMAAEQSPLRANHIKGSEANVTLARAQTPFMAMQGISATPISDQELAKISGQGSFADQVNKVVKKLGGAKKKRPTKGTIAEAVKRVTKKLGGVKKKGTIAEAVKRLTKDFGGVKKKRPTIRKIASELEAQVRRFQRAARSR